MPQSFSQVYVHITFSTKKRVHFINDKIKEELWAYLGGSCKALECDPVRVGGHTDHIHICCLLSKKLRK
jgi:REP element-mobilizing transposase RayT